VRPHPTDVPGGRVAALAGLTLVLALGCAGGGDGELSFEEATIADVEAALASGRVTCRELVQRSLDRIAAIDDDGPRLNAILETNADALAIADALDAAGGPVGPLHCVPLVVKDNFGTGDAMRTTAASLTMGDFVAPADAFVAAKLRAAGAVFVAKSNMDEWAFGVSGYSSRGGQTLDAYKLDRIPGGSSGGSAVAVAAGMAILATGSDTAGSVRIPAAFNSLVGIKPTLGLLGRSGIIPASENLDVPGPLARTVADAAKMLGVMTGVDPDDPATAASAGRSQSDYTPSLVADGLRGARVGVLREIMGVPAAGGNPDVDAAFASALAAIERLGADLVDPVAVAPAVEEEELLRALGTIGSKTFPPDLNGYLAGYGATAPLESFDDLLAASRALGPEVVRNLPTFEGIAAEPPPTAEEVAAAEEVRARYTAAVLAALDGAGAEALVFPTLVCPPGPLPDVVDPDFRCDEPPAGLDLLRGAPPLMASVGGLPEIAVPAGFTADGLPISVSFLGRPFSEATLIRLAHSFEQATRARRPPRFLRGRS
jgi:Asp-tRNA(Asn)/Glu-tRNA(Gln) amidotransferase A subunit family amidase